jgi:hypothetical protein
MDIRRWYHGIGVFDKRTSFIGVIYGTKKIIQRRT